MPRLTTQPIRFLDTSSGIALDKAHFTAICLAACKRLPAMRRTAEARRLDRFVAAEAWFDAILALIAIELPDWQLRRLAYDDGEWHCALSMERNMPDWLDNAVETHDADMSIALLAAFQMVAARQGRSPLATVQMSSPSPGAAELMSCENYA